MKRSKKILNKLQEELTEAYHTKDLLLDKYNSVNSADKHTLRKALDKQNKLIKQIKNDIEKVKKSFNINCSCDKCNCKNKH
ncbi:hypothetical protein [Thermohalobacter berrensis]|uniref:Uncharacterized protein n=1 Tax=Thermohalobacter berrensis TaxID=99594 RepID=A0A419TB36_9FIRM|nr:hypothetical protein [Thermohalobacter berrensis]RKD34680.1 hypothetical protein BET03_02310 [Thermohalobacter berrensis]